MTDIKKILFPYDLSESGGEIVPYLLSVAEAYNSEVYLLHVVDDLGKWGKAYIPHPSMDAFQAEASKAAETAMDDICEKELKGYSKLERRVVSGDPIGEILKTIASEDIDLVIMGTHGRRGLEHMLMGSVAENVVKRSSVPVMTIHSRSTK
ncbi:MAG: universal stress protein [Thermodesulfobacteriota bacterium]|nr:universal stress protein [Thermodesulfobacteriota bacterium]